EAIENRKKINRLGPLTHFINCWHHSEYESEAMWKLYARNDEGLAIKSSLARLSQSLDVAKPEIYVAAVEYLDYTDSSNVMADSPFLYKRRSLEHEREIRAFTKGFTRLAHARDADILETPGLREELIQEARDRFGVELDPESMRPPTGLSIPIDLDLLIAGVL